jgi:biopolymer transport protein ExbD
MSDSIGEAHPWSRPGNVRKTRLGESPQSQLVDAGAVGALWRSAVAVNPNLIAAVGTGAEVPYGRTIDVLDQLQMAGASRISLQALND